MTTSSATVLQTTLTAHSGNYSSGALAVGDYNEMSLDITITDLTADALIQFSRIDLFNNVISLWGSNESPGSLITENVDIGQSFSYTCTRSFGNSVQIDITTTGTFSATLSLIGKG